MNPSLLQGRRGLSKPRRGEGSHKPTFDFLMTFQNSKSPGDASPPPGSCKPFRTRRVRGTLLLLQVLTNLSELEESGDASPPPGSYKPVGTRRVRGTLLLLQVLTNLSELEESGGRFSSSRPDDLSDLENGSGPAYYISIVSITGRYSLSLYPASGWISGRSHSGNASGLLILLSCPVL